MTCETFKTTEFLSLSFLSGGGGGGGSSGAGVPDTKRVINEHFK